MATVTKEYYGYIVDPLMPITDGSGNIIRGGYLKVFLAGSSTKVVTYKGWGVNPAVNSEEISIGADGRLATMVIALKTQSYKIMVLDSNHDEGTPVFVKDNIEINGTKITTSGDIVQGLNDVSNTDGQFNVEVQDNTLRINGAKDFAARDDDNIKCTVITNNPEYAYAVVDGNGVFLFGVKSDGSVEWQKGVPGPVYAQMGVLSAAIAAEVTRAKGAEGTNATAISSLQSGKVDKVDGKGLVDSTFANGVSVVSNPEYAYAVVDADGKFLFGVKSDGSFEWQKGIPQNIKDEFSETISEISEVLSNKVDKVSGKSLVDSVSADSQKHEDNEMFSMLLKDSDSKVIETLNKNGQREFIKKPIFRDGFEISNKGLSDFEEILVKSGFTKGFSDWSKSESLRIEEPKIAVVNFSGIASMPTSKNQDLYCVIDFWDGNGNYFKKNAIANAQGQSTLSMPKKNIAVDFLNEDGSSFKLKIGNWVEQDSFHIKAFYVDMFRGVGQVAYDFLDEIWKSRGLKDVPWKQAMFSKDENFIGKGSSFNADDIDVRIDSGARNHPLGVPCVVCLNGSFYGVFAFALKKHRDNYHHSKNNTKHIHLDGVLTNEQGGFWDGVIDWTRFEVRNPKGLKDIDGNSYDGDNPKELSNDDSKSKEVKDRVTYLSNSLVGLKSVIAQSGKDSSEMMEYFESKFDVDNLIDFIIFTEVIGDFDAGSNNIQWLTYDGVKWFACPYDLDRSFGNWAEKFDDVRNYHFVCSSYYLPFYFILHNATYKERMESRFADLRDSGIINKENIFGYVKKWAERIGIENYKKEFEKWNNSPSNRDISVNTHWSLKKDSEGNAILGESSTYDSLKNYAVGETCFYGYNSVNGYYQYECNDTCVNTPPVDSFGWHDSYERIFNWICKSISTMDNLFNYNKGN